MFVVDREIDGRTHLPNASHEDRLVGKAFESYLPRQLSPRSNSVVSSFGLSTRSISNDLDAMPKPKIENQVSASQVFNSRG